MKTKEQQLKEAKADRDKAWADFWEAEADLERAYDRIQELEKQK